MATQEDDFGALAFHGGRHFTLLYWFNAAFRLPNIRKDYSGSQAFCVCTQLSLVLYNQKAVTISQRRGQ